MSVYGWWRPALTETHRVPRWVWVFPAVLAAAAVIGLFTGDTSRITPVMWLYLVLGSVLVGFNEEMATRGQPIVALRSRFGELGVWFFSTLLFGLLHLPNTRFGVGALGLIQPILTFLAGTIFYLLPRVAGTLIAAMALHGLWDFSTFAASSVVNTLIGPLVGVIALIVAIRLHRRENLDPAAPPASTRSAS